MTTVLKGTLSVSAMEVTVTFDRQLDGGGWALFFLDDKKSPLCPKVTSF